MRELMLELLCYEPFGKFLPEEEEYICKILSEKKYYQPPSMVHDLFLGFHQYVQRVDFKAIKDIDHKAIKDIKDIGWLQSWMKTYHQNQNYTQSTKSGRAYYPLLFKKIAFYIVVHWKIIDKKFTGKAFTGKVFTGKAFMAILGLHVNLISKWGLSTQFRSSAEADSYSIIRTFRAGVKKPYIVSLVKRLYYEAGRQGQEAQENKNKKSKKIEAMTLKKLPTFVDVFAGTAGVAASMTASKDVPAPIVNDYDPVMICFAWGFTHCQSELRKRIAGFHNDLINQDFESTDWSYDADAYEGHHDPQNLLTTPEVWDDPVTQSRLMEFFGYSKADIEAGKMLAQRHQEFVMRVRSSYLDIENVLDEENCDRDNLRKINFNSLPPNRLEDVLDYALAMFLNYSFPPSGKNGNVYHETIVDACSYFSYLSRLQVDLGTVRREDRAVKAWTLTELQLKSSSLTLESTGNFSKNLKNAEFYCKDFEVILKDDPSNKIYYLDSPYFLTVGYDVGFFDEDHQRMLDCLRGATFKWIFSLQYNASARCKCTISSDEAARKKQEHIIKDYGTYYRGFYAPFQLAADQRTYYVPTDAPMEKAKDLYAILFDFGRVKQKWPEMRTATREMLVVNFNPLRTIPLHDSAVVLPFHLFLQCADEGMAYRDIVQRAIDWRKNNITNNFTGKTAV